MAKNNGKYAYLNRLSTEQLEELLRMDIEEAESGNEDVVFHILEVIEKRENEHPTGSIPDVDKAWAEFQEYYNVLEGVDTSLYPCETEPNGNAENMTELASPHKPRLRRCLKQVLVAVVAVAAVFGGMVVAQASGFDVFGALAKWTEDAFSFGDITEQSVQANTQDLSIKTAEQPKEFEEMKAILEEDGQTLYFPQIPTEFRLVDSSLYINPRTDETTFMVGYENEDTFVGFQVIQYCNRMPAAIHEKDNTIMEEYEFSGIMHYIFGNNGATSAVWLLNNIEYTLWTNSESLDIKELVQSTYCEGLL